MIVSVMLLISLGFRQNIFNSHGSSCDDISKCLLLWMFRWYSSDLWYPVWIIVISTLSTNEAEAMNTLQCLDAFFGVHCGFLHLQPT